MNTKEFTEEIKLCQAEIIKAIESNDHDSLMIWNKRMMDAHAASIAQQGQRP